MAGAVFWLFGEKKSVMVPRCLDRAISVMLALAKWPCRQSKYHQYRPITYPPFRVWENDREQISNQSAFVYSLDFQSRWRCPKSGGFEEFWGAVEIFGELLRFLGSCWDFWGAVEIFGELLRFLGSCWESWEEGKRKGNMEKEREAWGEGKF